jgi:hypothetical protein
MTATDTRVYFANRIGGFDLRNVFCHKPSTQELRDAAMQRANDAASFIATACNEHETLKADNQRLNIALASIRATLETVALDLDDAASTEALLVHALLLQRADHLKVKHDADQCATCRATDKALSAAGVTE